MITEAITDFGDVKAIRVGRSLAGRQLMTVIYYHLDEILIDTGPYCARKSVAHYLGNHRIEKALLTHCHEDHAGNVGLLLEKGIRVFGHEKSVAALSRRHHLKPYEYILFGKLESAQIESVATKIQTKRHVLLPIHTPGHSHDHTVYYEPDRGWLFSGDLFLSPKIKIWRQDEDMLKTIASLERVLELDLTMLFCGHNPQLNYPKKALEMKKNQLLTLVETASKLLTQGLSRREIIGRLCKGRERYFEKWLTLGDASYQNMVDAAISAAMQKTRSE